MSWQVRYSRVGNAQPVYAVERTSDQLTALGASVEDVMRITGRPKRAVQIACKEAREDGVSHFLD